MRRVTKLTLFSVGLMALVTMPALAGTVTATGSGWCDNYLSCNNTDTSIINNNYAGGALGYSEYHDWFAFDIPMLGVPITSAAISIWNDGSNYTMDATRTYTLYSTSGISWSGLVSGSALGSVTAGVADTGVSQWVTITLNATALSLLNAAQGSQFIFGGGVDLNTVGVNVDFFGYTDGTPAARLDLNATAIPEPGTIGMLLAGLGALALAARRRRV